MIMNKLQEKIGWYKELESRRWKLVWHAFELTCISLVSFTMCIVLYIKGDGTHLQLAHLLFTFFIGMVSICLAPSVYGAHVFQRWQIHLIVIGLGCGAGLSALAGILILSMQSNGV